MVEDPLCESIEKVRKFNRFYTKRIGLLEQGLLKTRYPLTQARIIFELAQHEQTTARDLVSALSIDPGYLSRILSIFEKDGLIQKTPSKSDNRQRVLKLTAKGRKSFHVLNNRSSQEVKGLLQSLSGEDQHRLIHAMRTITDVLETESKPTMSYLLRRHKPGDIGWMVHRHGVLYAEEYGFDETFEALAAEILARFIQDHDPKQERIWIAESAGERIGSVMIVDGGNRVAKLRLLLVEPKVRGQGIGQQLIKECVDFSKRNGYGKITLWTQSILKEARHLYSKAGFKLVEEKPHTSFGHDLVAETWELEL
ncbi:MAG: MarR family transcriptional regulator [Gemmatimonadota bacterium]|nr:MAG: MarR family transcriptional regulator [Gemmatimonadota bacterium]